MLLGAFLFSMAGTLGLSLQRWLKGLLFVIPPAALLISIGPRVELIAITLGLLILSFDLGRWFFLQGLLAAGIAFLFGFRIRFFTNPAGGYFNLDWAALPLTILWVLVILISREKLRRLLPRPPLQVIIDLILVVDAILLALISSQTRAVPIAANLPFVLLGMVLATGIAVYRRGFGKVVVLSRTVAFSLALYGISGVMKAPVSLFILAPLTLLGFPIMSASYALIAQAGAVKTRSLPSWLQSHGYTSAEGIMLLLVGTSSLAVAAVLSVQLGPVYGLLSAGIIPGFMAARLVYRRLSSVLSGCSTDEEFGQSRLFGVSFHNLSFRGATHRIERMVAEHDRTHVIVTPNSPALLLARRDRGLAAAYRRADLVIPDGIGIVWATRMLGAPLKERITGIDLARLILSSAGRLGYRVFLLGGRKGVAERAADRLKQDFPGLNVVGTQHGYFDNDERVIQRISQAGPDILLVGMGVPRQEKWMADHQYRVRTPLMIGIGGALDIFSGDCKRAPEWWQRSGLEWLYRLLRQPWRIKTVLAIPRFIGLTLLVRASLSIASFFAVPQSLE
jgi:N-acetylglucosaminyldiphosphoundecaprenol N-acetyl-beta-D-mannosaminyltransferase